jgi:hypothetical protein
MQGVLSKHVAAVLMFLFSVACEREVEPLKSKQITRDEAVHIVLDKLVRPDTVNAAIYTLRDLLPKSAAISVFGNASKSYRVDYESWFLLIDDAHLILNWPHHCRYVFVNAENGSYAIFNEYDLPARFSEMDTVFTWAKPQAKSLPPLTFSDKSRGCGNIFVYKLNQECTAAIVVKADTAKLHLSTATTTFDLHNRQDGLAVYVDFYYYLPEGNGFIGQYYCNDVFLPHKPPKKWLAQQGRVQITLTELGSPGMGYRATIRLDNALFVDENDQNEIALNQLIFKEVFVGWLPG